MVNTLISRFKKNVFSSEAEGIGWMDNFLKQVFLAILIDFQSISLLSTLIQEAIVRKEAQGGHALEGNQARKFLRKVDSLEQTLMKENINTIIAGMPYVAALRAFDRVVVSCFGMELSGDYKQTISRFSQLYRELDISVTPKV